jgi:hypothetical protein
MLAGEPEQADFFSKNLLFPGFCVSYCIEKHRFSEEDNKSRRYATGLKACAEHRQADEEPR